MLQSMGSQRIGLTEGLNWTELKNIQLSKDLTHQSLEHRVPHCTLNSLKGCWRSTAIAARGSISIEADGKCLCCSVVGDALGKCQFVVDSLNNRGQIQNKMLKSLSITLHPKTSYVSLQNETLVLTVWCSSFQLFSPPNIYILYEYVHRMLQFVLVFI